MQKADKIYLLKSWIIPLLFLFYAAPSLYAVDVTLAWERNAEPDVLGYRIYYGIASRTYSRSIDVGNVTAYTVTGLGTGIYFFAVTAYNAAGLESGYSNEVWTTVSSTTPSGCDINGDATVNVLDLQVLINGILGINGALGRDLNSDGRIDVLDLQILGNVILGLRSCPIL